MIDLEQFAVVTENVGPWVLHLVCCGRDEGMLAFATRDQADAAREAYTSGQGVADHGYSADASGSDHRRAAILYTLACYSNATASATTASAPPWPSGMRSSSPSATPTG